MLRPFLLWMNRNQVTLVPRLVPSKDMLADGISSWRFDPGEYSLNLQVFVTLMGFFRPYCTPDIDMFASPSNARLPLFCARWPHHQAHLVDALSTDLTSLDPRVRTPAVVHYRQVVTPSSGAPKSKVPHSRSLMGFRVMMAPVNSLARPIHSSGEDKTEVRPLRECLVW